MIAINDISYYIGERVLYDAANLHIKPHDKIGLIGLNGQGKTTLLRMINGDITPHEGSISRSKDCTIGFLNQDLLSFESDKSIHDVALEAFSELLFIQKKIDKIIKKLETDYSDDLVTELTTLQEKFEIAGGYKIEAETAAILEGIGFTTEDLSKPLSQFSGGWRMRVMLAKLLLQKPSLLMMDEPTNHLDLPSIQWVEEYLSNYEGAFIVVSHDREFLDRTINKTVDVTNQKLISYEGNYSFYEEEKELRNEIQANAYQNQQQKIKQTERFINRFRAKSSKARQVQSKIKNLEKMDKIEDVSEDLSTINFQFTFSQASGKDVLEVNINDKSYGENIIFNDTKQQIVRGDKIALVGANGMGKSTLLRILSGSEKFKGKLKYGHNIIQGFYAQHQLEALDVNNEILEELKLSGSGKTELELRNLLGCFLFTGEDVYKKIKVLSGGEKSRVALSKTLISESNFLLLDEPTNHLDYISENILIQALQQYQGTFIIVSHNRKFISEVANKIWYIEDCKIKEYPGTFKEYLYWIKNIKKNTVKPESAPVKNVETERNTKTSPEPKKVKTGSTGNFKITRLEDEIETLESKLENIKTDMNDQSVVNDSEKLESLAAEYEATDRELAGKMEEWEELVASQS